MDRSIEYAQALSNFDSVYNAPTHLANPTLFQAPTFSSFPEVLYRPASPLFRQCASPTSRVPLLYGPGPKFNFDLYTMDDDLDVYERDSLNSYRPQSPFISTEIRHDAIYSLLQPSDSKLQALERLRHVNDEMCQSLARSEAVDAIHRPPQHYHIHHYPVSQPMAVQRLPIELEAVIQQGKLYRRPSHVFLYCLASELRSSSRHLSSSQSITIPATSKLIPLG